jgi:predicted amidohydrolase YtcJ
VRTLYRATRVRTQSFPETGEWLLIDGRHVQRVGSGDQPQADRVVDLPGATIVPGFIDSHVHLTSTGMGLGSREVEDTRSAADLLAIVRRRAGEIPGEGPVFLQGYDESGWHDPSLPAAADLDDIARPVVVRRVDGHASLTNSAALSAGSIVDLEGIERDVADGSPTGRLTGPANEAMGLWAARELADHDRQALQLQAAGLAASRGITAVHEMTMPQWLGEDDLRVLLGHRGRLPVDVLPMVATMDLPLAIEHRLPTVGGDLPADGSIGARTAFLADPYADVASTGRATYTDDDLAEFFHGGHAAGLQVGIHAIGDRAIEQVIGVWERVYHALDSRERRHFRARRHRIEHAEMITPGQIERAAMLGLALSMQPAFDRRWGQRGGLYEQALGAVRAETMNPIRTLLDRGVEVGVGSDSPVTALDPMACLEALESHHHPAQRLARAEAFRLHTIGSARIGRQEDKKGVLAPGFHADFVAFEDDPFTAPSVVELRPALTVSLGREVFAG